MGILWVVFPLILLLQLITCSLIDFRACQKKFNCTQNLIPAGCPPGELLDTQLTNGCCHGCRLGIGRGESGCSSSKQCAPGLECDSDFYCILNRKSCLHTLHFEGGVVGWMPKCEVDGTFSAKQCRGDKVTGRCFCYAETGEKVFGWDWWRDANNMTCACSRQRFRAEAAGRIDVTLHCKTNGNFEELQCDMGICWCADEYDGHILKGTFAVPESLLTYLPCYNESFHGDQYLRKCESAAFAQKIMQKKLINRGAINAVPNQIQCNYHGSYGDIVIENPLAFCQMPDGSKLNYATPSRMMSEMNCNCARDEKTFKISGMKFNLRCTNNGNYDPLQDQNGKIFCVDRDGYAVSPLFEPEVVLDCNKYLYYALITPSFINHCARDEKIFKTFGIKFNLRCKDNGNYDPHQDQNGNVFCVDRDGYAVSPLLEPDAGLDCDQYFYYAQEDIFIEEDIVDFEY